MLTSILALPPADPGKSPQPDAPGGGGGIESFFPMLLILFVALLFLPALFNKKERNRQKRLTQLKKHDRVVTSGGIYGTVVTLDDQTATVEVARDVRLKMKRSSIYDLEKPGEAKDEAAAKAGKKAEAK